MSATVRAPARTRPDRRPRPEPPARPQLEVVGPPRRRRPAPSTRTIVAGGVVIFVLLFALAAFQAVLVSSQQRLDELDQQVAVEQDTYEDLRVEVAQLEAPDRILDTAQYELGMIPAGQPTYVTPSPSVAAEIDQRVADAEVDASDASAGGPSAGDVDDVATEAAPADDPAASSWPAVKPYLEPGQ